MNKKNEEKVLIKEKKEKERKRSRGIRVEKESKF